MLGLLPVLGDGCIFGDCIVLFGVAWGGPPLVGVVVDGPVGSEVGDVKLPVP